MTDVQVKVIDRSTFVPHIDHVRGLPAVKEVWGDSVTQWCPCGVVLHWYRCWAITRSGARCRRSVPYSEAYCPAHEALPD